MYVLIVGGGKVGLNLTRELVAKGHEVTLIEGDRSLYLRMQPGEFSRGAISPRARNR